MNNKEKILGFAEEYIRTKGYHGFSFRDLAMRTEIKSASVHYHFPTKEDLVVALIDTYSKRTSLFLESYNGQTEADAVRHLTKIFDLSITEGGQMCLCGMLASEIDGLPEVLKPKLAAFMDLMIDWLQPHMANQQHSRAEAVVATLEGALILARAKGDPALVKRMANAFIDAANIST
jgi:TetR/AcrR family transcriptional repressor of nem operon